MLTIYKASAGSGKTYQLALHYLKMVLGIKPAGDGKWRLNRNLLTDNPSKVHRSILAITFTNKATEEMKSRIIASLNAVALAEKPDDHPYIKSLMDEFDCSFDNLRTAARHAMVSVLLDFSFFNVSTIDSFFQTVLRMFARELGIQGDYNIEISSKNAIRDALILLLDDLNSHDSKNEDESVKRVRDWIDNRAMGAAKKFNPFKRDNRDFETLVGEIEKIFKEDFKPLQFELYEYFEDMSRLDRFRSELSEMVEDIPDRIVRAGHKADTALRMSGQYDVMIKRVQTFIENLCNGKIDLSKPGPAFLRLAAGIREIGKNEYGLLKHNQPNDVYLAAMDELSADLGTLYRTYCTAKVLLGAATHLQFVSMMLKFLDEVRSSGNLLILDDTSTYISRIIGKSNIPFIYERLGTVLHHFLIDEFQDTSRLQWRNLLPLVDTGYSEGEDSLIIGDIKQAIYRFRNSDSSILGHILENVNFRDEELRQVLGDSRQDNCNYRTCHGIVRFNNTIMPAFAALALGTDTPDGFVGPQVRQMCAKSTAWLDGKIRIYPYKFAKSGNSGADTQEYDISGNLLEQPPIDSEELLADVIIANIRRQHDIEGIPYSEIAILFKNHIDIEVILKKLLLAGIPLQSEQNLLLKNAPSVRLIMAVMSMLSTAGLPESRKVVDVEDESHHNSDKTEHYLFESRYNFFRYQGGRGGTPMSAGEAIECALDRERVAEVNFNEDESVTVPKTLDDAIRTILDRHPATLVAVIESIVSSGLVPRATVLEERDYISTLTDLALQYSENRDNDINGFLSWWELRKDKLSIIPPADCDAVHVMTIHRSKGLEFKCVHLVKFSWDLVEDRETAWVDVRPDGMGNTSLQPRIDLDLPIEASLYPPLLCIPVNKAALGYPGSPFTGVLDKVTELMKKDSLNLAYVALTRAKTDLSIYAKFSSNANAGTVGDILGTVLDSVVGQPAEDEDCIVIPEAAYNRETKALSIDFAPACPLSAGERAARDAEAERAKSERARKQEIIESMTQDFISVSRSDMAAIVNVESFEPSQTPDDETVMQEAEDGQMSLKEAFIEHRKRQKMENTQRGLDLHEILSHIRTFSAGKQDVNRVVSEAIREASGSDGFVSENVAEYERVVGEMLSAPEAARWFDPSNTVDTEVAYQVVFDSDGSINTDGVDSSVSTDDIVSAMRRIDRLVELPDGSFEIVDYKFSRAETIDYGRQVYEYMTALRAMYPDREVRGYLWYYDLGVIRQVDERFI